MNQWDSKHLLTGMEECKYATGETNFEAKAFSEIRTGFRSRRANFFSGRRCISIGRAGAARRAANAKLRTNSSDHSW